MIIHHTSVLDQAGNPASLVVVKLGGSLLRREDWPQRLLTWLDRQPMPRCHVMIVGGGDEADAVREADRLHNLGNEQSHWLAIEAMQRNTAAAASRFPQSSLLCCLRHVRQISQAAQVLWFDPLPWLRAETGWRGLPPLPHSWDVTSDSIAARVACRLGNVPLVLLKSALPPEGGSLVDWANQRYVDAYFPQAAAMLAGKVVNLADHGHVEAAWCGANEASCGNGIAE